MSQSAKSSKRKQAAASEGKKVRKGMAGPVEVKMANGFVWRNDIEPTVYFLGPAAATKPTGKVKIASFDMDHTLIAPKSGAVFPKGRSDWTWWDDSVPERLRKLYSDGFTLAIFSNQGGIAKGNQSVADITGKICDLIEELGVPLYACIACDDNQFRKPNVAMWDMLANQFFGGVANIDGDDSLYCGDAAGRAKGWAKGKKKDFSASDRKFAFNVGVAFSTPEELFFGEAPVAFDWGAPLPRDLLAESAAAFEEEKKALGQVKGRSFLPNGWIGAEPLVYKTQELIVFCGVPASGKSSWAKKHLIPHGYEWINQDTLKTKEKCVQRARELLAKGKSVIVDNTNPEVATRGVYIGMASDLGIPCRCFHFKVSRELASHLNHFREKASKGERKRLSRVVFNVFWSKWSDPEQSEGFTDVCSVHFLPAFDSADVEKLFLQLNE